MEEMAVYDPHEDDRGRGGNPIAVLFVWCFLVVPCGIALVEGLRWFLHHAK